MGSAVDCQQLSLWVAKPALSEQGEAKANTQKQNKKQEKWKTEDMDHGTLVRLLSDLLERRGSAVATKCRPS